MADVPTPSRVASSTTSVEEITLLKKKPQVDKRKERASSQPSCVWDNTDLAQTKAQEVFSIDELKVLFGVPPNKMVGCHVHKLIQVICSSSLSLVCFFFFFFFMVESPL